jgi:hypothetical protein
MKALVDKYSACPPHERDYLNLLEESDLQGEGKNLIYDAHSLARLRTVFSETEAKLEVEAVLDVLTNGQLYSQEKMQVSCDMEYRTFFEPNNFSKVLLVGSGGYPQIALYALQCDNNIRFSAVDRSPYATVLCSMLAAKLGYEKRLEAFTCNALELAPAVIRSHDGFFIHSAVKPKNKIVERLLIHKRPDAKVYAREGVTHPDFYEPVTFTHPDLLTSRQAYDQWSGQQETAVHAE